MLHAGANPGGGCLEQPRVTVMSWPLIHQLVNSPLNLFAAVSPKTFSIAEKHELSHVKFSMTLELNPQK